MESYFDTKDKKNCNGCGTCELRCPKKAIIMKEDEEGFLYPVIDERKCIKCGLCKKICSNNPTEHDYNQDTYIAINKNEKVKKDSSSGGIFYPIAKYVIEQGGIVFGVEYDNNLKVRHAYAKNINDLKKFQGSKYVRSDLNNSYIQVEEFLKEDKYVLFTGTPCQCYGLKKYLKKTYNKLITCEIVCHANPSPKVFEYYKKNLEFNYSKKIKNVYFRSKINGWRNSTSVIELEDNTLFSDDKYYCAFVNELINRPSCSNCRFCEEIRYSDFTIADFWGIEKVDSSIENDNTGISLLNVNTVTGRNILEKIKSELFLKEVDTHIAFSYNHHCNVEPNKNRKKFFKGIEDGSINETNVIKYLEMYTRTPFYRRVLRKIKRIVKDIMNK